jgi:hypothetical protein
VAAKAAQVFVGIVRVAGPVRARSPRWIFTTLSGDADALLRVASIATVRGCRMPRQRAISTTRVMEESLIAFPCRNAFNAQ